MNSGLSGNAGTTAGDISIQVGISNGENGELIAIAGQTSVASGGQVSIITGHGVSTSSDALLLQTSNAGVTGVSGQIVLSTGTSSSGNSGHAGNLKLIAGSAFGLGKPQVMLCYCKLRMLVSQELVDKLFLALELHHLVILVMLEI